MVQKLVPLCSSQYERQFNTVRVPGKEAGRILFSYLTLMEKYFYFELYGIYLLIHFREVSIQLERDLIEL